MELTELIVLRSLPFAVGLGSCADAFTPSREKLLALPSVVGFLGDYCGLRRDTLRRWLGEDCDLLRDRLRDITSRALVWMANSD